jgi:glycogen debranching enzyme
MKQKILLIWAIILQCLVGQKMESFRINLSTSHVQKFVFGNKVAGFWMGQSLPGQEDGYSGWIHYNFHYLKNIHVKNPDGDYKKIILYPDHLERKHKNYTEKLFFIDNFDVTYLRINNRQLTENIKVIIQLPLVVDSVYRSDANVIIRYNTSDPRQPSYACIGISDAYQFFWNSSEHFIEFAIKNKPTTDVVVSLGYSESGAIRLNQDFFRRKSVYLSLRKSRFENLIWNNPFKSADRELMRAYYWALLAMDDLVTYQGGPGIFAGYPWFNDYWGRDTFISLPGALLVTGQWELARKILLHFGKLQIRDVHSKFDGRIPNRIQIDDTIYNTADGTPWFFYALQRYVDYTGDTSIMNDLFPALAYFIESIRHRYMDQYGFIVHGEAETWMDAVGKNGPWSPRGNRAIEIQALWLKNLETGIFWAKKYHHSDLVAEWQNLYQKVRKNFKIHFLRNGIGIPVDHINQNGEPDPKIRPNMGFVAFLNHDNKDFADSKKIILKTLIKRLTFPYGVATLLQDDPDFHPYHIYPPYYEKDEAYHNGLIWVWLNGMVKSICAENGYWDLFFTLLSHENRQIFELDGIGTLSELVEPVPRKHSDGPIASGTISQAWSLAEYIRTFQEDLVGIQPKFLYGDTLLIRVKKLPEQMLPFEKVLQIRNSEIRVLQIGNKSRQLLHIVKKGPDRFAGKIFYHTPNGKITLDIPGGELNNLMLYLFDTIRVATKTLKSHYSIEKRESISFVIPEISKKWPVIFGRIHYQVLEKDEILHSCTVPAFIHLQEKDPGEKSAYLYPENPVFKKGIADVQSVDIVRDGSHLCFRVKMKRLVDPGWRPGSGFQLTMLLLAIQSNVAEGKTFTMLPFSSEFHLSNPRKFSYFILIGNGIEVYDSNLRKLAVYIPPKTEGEYGNPVTGEIVFSLPENIFKKENFESWKLLVLSGLQDDHGNGGIGEFRQVDIRTGWWKGGGRKEDLGNVYDWLSNIEGIR